MNDHGSQEFSWITEAGIIALIRAGREIGGSMPEFVTTDVTDCHG
jgi:hypothetical protein